MRLSEELARILRPPARRKRRPAERDAPREIVPSEPRAPRLAPPASPARDARAALDAARERLKAQIPPPGDDA